MSSPNATPTKPAEPNAAASDRPLERQSFHISPLIRITLMALYVALTIPLPFLGKATGNDIPLIVWIVGLSLGALALYGALAERVVLNKQGIQVTYPIWVPKLFRRGWQLDWQNIQSLKPRTTGQGGLVYYFLDNVGQAYLLPMRVAGFAALVRQVEQQTGIDTRDVRPLAQPWMYLILLAFTGVLLLIDTWVIWTALHFQPV